MANASSSTKAANTSSSQPTANISSAASSNNMAKLSSIYSVLKAYWIPLTLFFLFLLFQLFVLPASFPPSHYDVLGIRRDSSIEQVKAAYEKLVTKWNSGIELPPTTDFVKIRYAFELLSNPLSKRDYDLFRIDEHLDVLEKIKQQYAGESFSKIRYPLLDNGSPDTHDYALNFISSEDFQSLLGDQRALLILVYSHGSVRCRQFLNNWKRIGSLVGEVVNTGVVELGEYNLASYLAEKKSTGHAFFRNGLPSLVAFPQGCRASKCLLRYQGDLSVDGITDWFATIILKLPRIPYYSKESLGPKFLAKSSHHKVKVIFFSDSGVRATPFVRQIAKDYQAYASFAFVLWREVEYSFWWTAFDVESAPATVFLKDPGTKPIVYYGPVNSSWFVNVMEQNKMHELTQLRSLTSMELGCDARGYSRAGFNTMIWYCVILIGRPSPEINKMRETMRRVQKILSSDSELNATGIGPVAEPSTTALKEKRLTFAWMDGELQKNPCMFYIGAELSMESCGPRRSIIDSSHIVIVRYMRNNSMDDVLVKRKPNSPWSALQDDVDPASQLVARYNGSVEIPDIIEWISKIIKDGDSSNLPFYRTKTPNLIPENADPLWQIGSEKIFSTSKGVKSKVQSILIGIQDLLADPRIGPMLLLGALISFGGIWLHRSQLNHSTVSNQPQQPNLKKQVPKEWRNRGRITPSGDVPPSLTDMEPKDAHQMPMSDSDSTPMIK
ncbi:hypothetical protein Nepgr_003217 [Nepenthes gracilis]|uniref:J domain-containing protein n=1 Tax=Nepenthes gracilis TaxID=150966 RepID=A0AAD3XD65_NEPGR|nr:hypothetical protein Nepgr_003217 [Nepenthes gracilis]